MAVSNQSQPLVQLGNYWICRHALQRIKSRLIKESEIRYTLESHDSVSYQTHHDRTIVYHALTEISVILDNKTNIIVTVTETDERKSRLVYKKHLINQTSLKEVYRPVLLCR